ncbi:MAG: hypothetical protein AAF518_20525 [Spirochaetota bacterium]
MNRKKEDLHTSLLFQVHEEGESERIVDIHNKVHRRFLWGKYTYLSPKERFQRIAQLGCNIQENEVELTDFIYANMQPEYETWFLQNFFPYMPIKSLDTHHVFYRGKEFKPHWRCDFFLLSNKNIFKCLEKFEKEKFPGGTLWDFVKSDYFQKKYDLLDYNATPFSTKKIIWILAKVNQKRVKVNLIKKGKLLYIPFPRKDLPKTNHANLQWKALYETKIFPSSQQANPFSQQPQSNYNINCMQKQFIRWKCIQPLGIGPKAKECLTTLNKEIVSQTTLLEFVKSDYFQKKYDLSYCDGSSLQTKQIVWFIKETNRGRISFKHIRQKEILYIPFLHKSKKE